jgi:hypothetical protein
LSGLLLFVGVDPVLQLQLDHLLLPLAHLLVKRLEGRLKHRYGVIEGLPGLFDGVLDQHPSDHLPAFAFALERFKIGKNEVVFTTLLLQFNISFEYLSVLAFQFVVVV